MRPQDGGRGGQGRENEWSQSGREDQGGHPRAPPHPGVQGLREKERSPLRGPQGEEWPRALARFLLEQGGEGEVEEWVV